MLLNGRLSFTLLMFTIFVVMVAVAWDYPPASRFAPLLIGIPGALLALGQLIVDIREQRLSGSARRAGTDREYAQPRAAADAPEPAGSMVKRELTMFAYFLGLVLGVILFGFWIAIPLFFVLFLRLHERDAWLFILSLTAAGTAVLYLVFDRLLSIALHNGFVTGAVLDWLGF